MVPIVEARSRREPSVAPNEREMRNSSVDVMPSQSKIASEWPWIVVLAIGVTLVALQHAIATVPNGDEMWTRAVVMHDWATTWRYLVQDGKHPPLYFLLQKLVLPDTGVGIVALRMVSILATSLAALVIWWQARVWGVGPAMATGIGGWFGTHTLVLAQSANARGYALLSLWVVGHAVCIAAYVSQRRGRWLAGSALLAVLAAFTHSFGIVFAATTAAAASVWMWVNEREISVAARTAPLVAVAPAGVSVLAWFAYATAQSWHAGGVTSYLEWVGLPTWVDRIYALGELLGNRGVAHGTTSFLAVGIITIGVGTVVSVRCGMKWHRCAVVLAAVFGVFVAQVLVSGIIAQAPLFGTRHVVPTAGLLALAAALWSARIREPRWRWLLAPLGAMSVVGLPGAVGAADVDLVGLAARLASTGQPPMLAMATYEYGDVSVLNFLLSPKCDDRTPFTSQYIAPGGSQLSAAPRCPARHAREGVPDDTRALVLVTRLGTERDASARQAVLAGGFCPDDAMRLRNRTRMLEVLRRCR